jgi:polar amino acid transport system substrate-binding protein
MTLPPRRALLACLLLALAGAAHADDLYSTLKEHGRVRIGVNLSGLPFGTYEPGTQHPVGFAVDLANDIGHKLGVATEVVPVVAANRALFLQQGKVDLLIANMTVTPERAAQLDYVPTPYEQLGGALVAPRNSGIKRWDDLQGKAVCISQGASFQQPLTERYHVKLKAFRGQSEVLLALRGNGCDAVVLNSPIMHELLRQPEWAGYEIPVADDLVPADSVIWLRKGEPRLQQALDRIVQDWHGSGWLLARTAQYQMVPSPLIVSLHAQYQGQPPLQVPVVPAQ